MQLQSILISSTLGLYILFGASAVAQEIPHKDVPKCPHSIVIKDGIVLDVSGWNYSIPRHLFDATTAKHKLKDGILVSDFPLPEVSHLKKSTNSVSGGLSSDNEEITENTESYTWDIQKINQYSQAVFYCNLHGDRNETPVPFILLYQKVPAEFKTCTVTYKSVDDNRIPESQTLECQ